MGLGKEFLYMIPKVLFIKARNYKLDFKIINFYFVKDNTKNMKSKLQHWEKIFINGISDRGFVFSICKELSKFNSKKTTQFLKWEKYMNRNLTKEGICLANKYMKKFATSYVLKTR